MTDLVRSNQTYAQTDIVQAQLILADFQFELTPLKFELPKLPNPFFFLGINRTRLVLR